MKIRHLLIGMLAIAGAVACKQDQPVEEPVLEVNKTAVALAATAGESTFNVTANNAWTASADADWVSLDPASGDASDKAVTVKVTAEDNTATEARTATVTVKSGDLTRSVKVSQAAAQGETPGPGDDPTPGDVSWSMMGCFVDNLWSTDVPMAKEGEWIVAKGAQFTELTFKIRGNASWDDATNIGVAPGSDRGVVNGKVTVVTAEYAKANLGGDAADIRINGEAGTYDVYFSFENLEVYVMEQGYKPGEKEPQNPDPVEITYTVVGTLNNINWNNSAPEGLMTFDGQYHVAKNVPFVTAATLYGGADQIEFKIVETGSWTGYGRVEDVVNPINTEIAVKLSGDNIMVSGAEGNYDVYFDKENAKVWVLTPGATPGDAPEAPVTPVTEGVIWENDGTVGAAAWSGSPYRFSIEGGDSQNECVAEIPAAVWAGMKVAPFCVNVAPAEGAEWWQIRILDGWWSTNDESGANDITPQAAGLVDNGDGTYTFQVDLSANTALLEAMDTKHLLFAGDGFIINKIYFGEPETPGEPEQPELEVSDWNIVGSFTGKDWGWDPAAGLALSVLDENFFVYYGLELPADAQWKFLQGTAWGGAEVGADRTAVEPNTIQAKGGSNIYVTTPGKYDIYLAADASKYYVMSEGKTPAEATEPAPVEVTYTVTGTLQGNNWNNMAAVGLMAQEGAYYVAKNVPFVTAAELYGGADQIEFKICKTGSWDAAYGAPTTDPYNANAEIPVAENGNNVAVAAPSGAYDVYFDKDNGKVWVMEPGLKPGETPAAPADVDIDGKQWVFTWSAMGGASCVIDLGVTEPGVAVLAYDMGIIDPGYAGVYYPYMVGVYTLTKTDGTSGVVSVTDIDSGTTIDIPYSNATETAVHFATAALLEEDVDCTLATSKIEISMESAEYLADGEYWIIANDKVATPLTSNYGYLQVANAIDGKSYAANAFTFTQVEEGLYTIQDANGKYYYQTGSYNSFNVSATDGGTDEYLWEVYDTGNGQYAIINYETGKYIQLDSQYGTYGCYMEEKGAMPTLVLAENPVPEPEPEQPGEGVYTTNVTCTTVSSAYTDGVATVNGVADVFTLKLGTSKLNGTATVTIPAGATEVSFYAVGWKNTNATLQFSVGGQVVGTQAIAANAGATGNPPYTMTVTDSDKYTLPLGSALAADTEVTVETTGSAYRAILFGIQAK